MSLFEPIWKTNKEEKLDEAMIAVRAMDDQKKLRDVAMNAQLPEVEQAFGRKASAGSRGR